jgi:peptide/nickel transport system substrate-binding protein
VNGKVKSNLLYIIVAILLLFVTVYAATGCELTSQQGASIGKYGGVLKIADQQDATPSLGYPGLMTNVYQAKSNAPAIETLLTFDENGKIVPWLASEYKEDAKSNSVTLNLRKGIKFHDGTDFNASAVKWNLDQWTADKLGGTNTFKSIDVVDDYTVRLNFSSWDSTVLSNLAQYVGMMISPTAFKNNGKDWCANNPVGTGPFQFVSWVKDSKAVFKKFDGYWQKGKPYLDGVEYIKIPDATVTLMSLKSKEINVVATLDSKEVASLKKEGFIIKQGGKGGGGMGYIPDSAKSSSPFANLKVRQAFAYAIDRDAIVKGIFGGLYDSLNQYAYNGHWAYNPSVVGYPYDLNKAKQLMAEAGYANGFKTKLSYLDSQPYNLASPAIQGMLTKIGIDASLEPLPSPKFNLVINTSQGWDGLSMGLASVNPDTLATLNTRYAVGETLASMIRPEDHLQAIKNAVSAPDFATKQKYVWEEEKLMIDKYCLQIMVYQQNFFAACSPDVRDEGWNDTPYRGRWNPADCWLEKK